MDGYYDLIAIYDEARAIAQENETREPEACPNDGTPLQDGPNGLFCPWDGWTSQ
jgi:hypothetical protein